MKNDIVERVWSENAKLFMDVKHNSQENILHPIIADIINENKGKKLLDFGCGDGRILMKLKDSLDIDIYDKNSEMIELALYRCKDKISSIFYDLNGLKENYYDIVLCSMVLICIDNQIEFKKVIEKISSCLKSGGLAIFAIPHPCFRNYHFSNFHTSYCESQPFNYLNNSEPFNVFINDGLPPSIAFTDYHWSLSYTLNKMIKSNLNILEIIETVDDFKSEKVNKLQSPFLIIKTNKVK